MTTLTMTTSALADIEAERAHYERRHERTLALLEAGRRDETEEADYADGVRFGLDLALMILRRHQPEEILEALSYARTSLDDPLALDPTEYGEKAPRDYAIAKIDAAMHALRGEDER